MKNFLLLISAFLICSCTTDENDISFEENIKYQTTTDNRSSGTLFLTEHNFPSFIEDVKENFRNNEQFIHEFWNKSYNNSLTSADFQRVVELMNLNQDINVDRLDELNHKLGVYDSLDDWNEVFTVTGGSPQTIDRCEHLLNVRNAMLAECENYIAVIEQICAGSVMAAWWLRSTDCDVPTVIGGGGSAW